jgi:hemoglobin
MKRRKVARLALCILSLNLISSCANQQRDDNLYRALNGTQGIERIVNSFVKLIAADKQILPYFAKSSVSHFKHGFITHLCSVSGGPCKYEGDNMVDIHTGMNINEADFNRVVELLIEAMEVNQIDYPTQNRVLAILAPLRGEVINI